MGDTISLQSPGVLINPAAAGFLQPAVCSCLSILAGQHAQQGPSQAVLWKDKLQTHLQSMGTTN